MIKLTKILAEIKIVGGIPNPKVVKELHDKLYNQSAQHSINQFQWKDFMEVRAKSNNSWFDFEDNKSDGRKGIKNWSYIDLKKFYLDLLVFEKKYFKNKYK